MWAQMHGGIPLNAQPGDTGTRPQDIGEGEAAPGACLDVGRQCSRLTAG